jgi:hypothetical protein
MDDTAVLGAKCEHGVGITGCNVAIILVSGVIVWLFHYRTNI